MGFGVLFAVNVELCCWFVYLLFVCIGGGLLVGCFLFRSCRVVWLGLEFDCDVFGGVDAWYSIFWCYCICSCCVFGLGWF